MWQLARARPGLVIAFVLAALLTVFLGGRIIARAIYWENHQNQAIQGWMTLGYIARSWGVDSLELAALAGFGQPAEKGHPQPLIDIARDRGVALAAVIAQTEAALQTLLAQNPARHNP
jgi:hypothetical protein